MIIKRLWIIWNGKKPRTKISVIQQRKKNQGGIAFLNIISVLSGSIVGSYYEWWNMDNKVLAMGTKNYGDPS